MEEFKKGDVVQFKLGDRDMMINAFNSSKNEYECVYFYDGKFWSNNFCAEVLRKVKELGD